MVSPLVLALFFLLSSSPFISVCHASLNITLDDEVPDTVGNGTVVYYPILTGPRTVWEEGADCSTCDLKPDADATIDNSWHDATYVPATFPDPPFLSLLFSGTAVYVYCVLPNHPNFTVQSQTNLSFILDGKPTGDVFIWEPNGTSDFLYNQGVYNNTNLGSAASLPGGQHNLTIIVYENILFDYALYTVDAVVSSTSNSATTSSAPDSTNGAITTGGSSTASSTSPSATTTGVVIITHSRPVGAIVGGVVGGIAALAILAAGAFFFLHRSRRRSPEELTETEKQTPHDGTIEPYNVVTPLPVSPPPDSMMSTTSVHESQPSSVLLRGKLSPTTLSEDSMSASRWGSHTTSTVRELQERLSMMQTRLDSMQDTRSQESSRLENEVLALREHVARLEADRHDTFWDASDPPPQY